MTPGMASMASYFGALVGQPMAVELLCRAVQQERIAPAYLFMGAQGIGRGLAAETMAELLLSAGGVASQAIQRRVQQRNHPDLLWVEPTYLHQGKRVTAQEAAELGMKRRSPPQIRLEQIREIARFLSRPPLEAKRAVVVVEQAETMAEAAANGLLKTLEEPGQATLILIAPDRSALLPTLVSRCQCIPFYRLSQADMVEVLTRTGQGHILQAADVLAMAQGSPGDAIAHWQQQQAMPEALLAALAQPPTTFRAALELARQIAAELDIEAQLWLITYLQHRYWQTHALGLSGATTRAFLLRLEQARKYLLSYVQPRLVWEVTLTPD